MEPSADQPRSPESNPAHDDVTEKAYAIYLNEGRLQGHAAQNWFAAEPQMLHAGSDHPAAHRRI